jgi:DNA-binding winged helix-turn-helix (wHTH) protein
MRPEPEKSIRSRRLFAIGPFRLDLADRLLSRDGQPVALTPKALETLVVLVERHGKLVTKEELFQRVWPDAFVEENNLAQHISTLRRVLGEGSPRTA